MRRIALILMLFTAGTIRAQEPPATPAQTTPPARRIDSPSEVDKLKDSCGAFKIVDCAEEVFTGKPVHVAVGTIAPQNGFGAGIAYLGHKTTETWRTSWNADAMGSVNGSWRAGFYLKLVHTPDQPIGVSFGTPPPVKANLTELPEHSVINVYAQAISLNKLTFFGLGPDTAAAGRSFYGMTQTIIGASGVKPFYEPLHIAFFGEMNGRFVNIRADRGESSLSIEQRYTEQYAPGLTSQPGTLQFGEGVRMRPVFLDDLIRLNYSLAFQEYVTPTSSAFTFARLTADLSHEFALYKKTTRNLLPRDANGPDDCALSADSNHPECPAITRDREGSIGLRFFLAASMTPEGNVVPFYFQPTLGGVDINGSPSLSSFQDFRFRAPNVLLIRQSFEHSIWGPIGFAFMVDEGKVALARGDLGSNPWEHSFSTGVTLRAGGFPQVFLLFAWGGKEGTHTIFNVNNALLGGSARPSLY